MCKVYNTIGCLTTIKSHLREYNIDGYKSLNELIDFQKNYSVTRQQIISNHKFLVEQEGNGLSDKIIQLDYSIKTKKRAVKQKLLSELKKLKNRLVNLASVQANIIQAFINYVKKIVLKLRIWYIKLIFNLKIENSLKDLTADYNKINSRYKYIVSSFDDAVMESCLPQLRELEGKKRIIDQLNNSIYGAIGEQKVVRELEKLSDDYILINDFNCRFNPAIYNRQENDYINSVQIDHILISPSGVFLIETKNWSQDSLNNSNLYSPVQQIKRANFALYKILNGEISTDRLSLNKHHWGDRKISIRNLVVLISHKPNEEFQYVKVLTLDNLLGYVNYFKPSISSNEVQIIATSLLNFI
ncbi:nuclease-related domain-containing protein [Mucilaginibacter sp. OK098]|uniref:nuclease-related domain-containing protein n=1 Tax=Mucilaginibacter sp. OK098 TaxID=1855297 RepID=UPI0009169482|nr:nuclease-related domain-containing protein [Mucilaginibacter sp. OK098]SHM20484.1 Nuclease-related domain-containing protein [Mucilaginibacter sp. OK098]